MVELIIVIVLTSILGTFVFQIFTQCLVAQRKIQVRKEHSDDAVLVLDQLGRELRQAVLTSIDVQTATKGKVLSFRKIVSGAANGHYLLYGLYSSEDKLVRVVHTTPNAIDATARTNVISDFDNNNGIIVAKDVSGFVPDDPGVISLTFNGENSPRTTSVYIRNN